LALLLSKLQRVQYPAFAWSARDLAQPFFLLRAFFELPIFAIDASSFIAKLSSVWVLPREHWPIS
jgi:hypothetical protein